jgi:serine/threonine-protein kinase RsbW
MGDDQRTSYLRVPARLENLAVIRGFVRLTGMTLGVDHEEITSIVLAVDEASTNIVVHGYQGRAGTIEVEVERENNTLIVRLRDRAPGFDPTTAQSPDLSVPLEERPIGGMGIHLIRQAMDEVRYRALPGGGNELTLTKQV